MRAGTRRRLMSGMMVAALAAHSLMAQGGPGGPGGGGGSGGGGGGEDEGLGNNLSVPVVFAEAIGILGLPTTTDTGLRPRPGEVNDGVLEYFDPSEVFVLDGTTYFPQQTTSHWQAQWRAGVAGAPEPTVVNWADNLTHQAWTIRSTIRVEAVLYQNPADTMTSYPMTSLLGEGSEELFGTTGTTAPSTYRTVYTPLLRLKLEKLLGRAGPVDPSVPVTTEAVFENYGGDGPGGFGAEVNGAGSIIYGYNWAIRQWPLTNAQKIGWWRITLSLDPVANYTVVDEETGASQSFSVPRNTSFSGLDAGDAGTEVRFSPLLVNDTTSVLEIELTERRTGGAPTPDESYTLTITPPANGTITTTGISCGADGTTCVGTFFEGTYLTLTAVPEPGYAFATWTGDADCLDGVVILNANTTCSALFASGGGGSLPESGTSRLFVVEPTGGTIYGPGIACGDAGDACVVDLPTGASVGLDAVPSTGSTFLSWSSECPGGVVSMTTNRTCVPTFSGGSTEPPPTTETGLVRLTIVRPTGGTVYAAGIACGDGGSACMVEVPAGGVTLGIDAIPSSGFQFDGWSGAGCGPVVTLNTSLTCTPSFSRVPED